MRTLSLVAVFLTLGAACATACGSSSAGSPAQPAPPATPDAGDVVDAAPAPDAAPPVDNGAPSTTYPAPHPPLPELVSQGGKVLATPKVYLIFYPGYPHETELQGLAQGLGATPYWTATTAEYGVGPIGYAGMIELTGETAPTTISDKEVEAFVTGKIASGAFGDADPNVIYTIVYPQSTTITMAGGPLGASKSCTSFGGYHGDAAIAVGAAAKKNFAFAVLPTCAAFGGLGELDGLTGAMSHELIEAVTDPFPSTSLGKDAAYASVDQDHFIWVILGGSESGDLCVPEANAFYKPQGFDYTVQRTWSNKLAKAGHDPCAPTIPGSSAYFNSAPVLTETVSLDLTALGSGPTDTKGVKIPVGTSKTIEIDLYSDAATTGPWTVSATDTVSKLTGQAPTLGFAWDRTKGVNGEKLHLTVTVKAAAGLVTGAHPFAVTSTLGTVTTSWPALVVDQ